MVRPDALAVRTPGRAASIPARAFPAGPPGPVLLPDGFSAVAASTAVTSVFTACRAPIPSARPKRTLSMLEV